MRTGDAKMMLRWRQRSRSLWTEAEKKDAEEEARAGRGGRSVLKDVEDERARAEACRIDYGRVERVASRECWGDTALRGLSEAQARGMAARERQGLQRPVQAGTAGPATLVLRGGVEGLRDHLKLHASEAACCR